MLLSARVQIEARLNGLLEANGAARVQANGGTAACDGAGTAGAKRPHQGAGGAAVTRQKRSA